MYTIYMLVCLPFTAADMRHSLVRVHYIGHSHNISYLHAVELYAVVVEGHEDDVHHDAERDEELRERIKHQDGENLRK